MSLSDIPAWLRQIVLGRDENACKYCGMSQVGQGSAFHVDHVWPRSRGGLTQEDNLVLQCPHCSSRKAGKVTGVDPVTGHVVALFHPLRQPWSDHFDLHRDGRCTGLDGVGRATVEALSMNHPLPLEARADQIAIGRLRPTAD